MKKTILLLAGIFVLLTSCDDSDPVGTKDKFEPGKVSIQFQSTMLIDEAFNFIEEEDLWVHCISGFYFYSQLPNAQLDYVIWKLSTKPYLRGSADIHDPMNRIQVYATLDVVDETTQQDWLETIEDLQLIGMQGDYKILKVIVPEGTEELWVEKFSEMPLVKRAFRDFTPDFELH